MTENRLAQETSPYLLQHKDNPVHWWAWGPEALAEAKRTGKPILLSVGYAACHWCHVMAHESFEDADTATVMNDLFVNIKVDREERPDIDAIYMGALLRFSDQGGWPLTMFLDSEARPFWGGTYFPKQAQYGRPGFVNVLLQVAQIYQDQPEKVRENASRIVASLEALAEPSEGNALPPDAIRNLVTSITRAVDKQHGGLSGAPKFPQWNVFWLLWRGAMAFNDEAAKQAVVTTLSNICQGGIYDHLGGGFSRYSVDELWLVPHFEKMLYDNALLIDLLTEVWRETREPLLEMRIRETVAWLAREMTVAGGGFAASLDADSEGEEGKFYVWGADEIRDWLGASDAEFFGRVYGVSEGGNFEGRTILNRLASLALLSADDERRLAAMRTKLLERRSARIRPGFDDKVLADWNGLMIAALARAGAVFSEPGWIGAASRAFEFILSRMDARDNRLWHSWRAGRARAPATASDYANMIWGALRLHQATGEQRYLEQARTWSQTLDLLYWDASSAGYFTSAADTDDVIVRLKPAHDDAVPSANAIQLSNLIALWALTGESTYSDRAHALYNSYSGDIARAPIGHCGLLAAGLDLGRIAQIAVTAGDQPGHAALQRTLYQRSVPGALEYCSQGNSAGALPASIILKASAGRSMAYVCSGVLCGLPAGDPQELDRRLTEIRAYK
jgi:uncharacterized protein YyaL (SSP411 family)